MDFKKIDQIIEKYIDNEGKETPSLIPFLQEVQEEYGWLPEQAFNKISKKLDIPLVNLYGLATFYNEFRLNPIGKYHISICIGTACHVQGAPGILAEFEEILQIKEGGVTPDEKFSLETVSCFGCCAVAPVIKVNDRFHGNMTTKKVKNLCEELKGGDS